nr:15500_t:CDS:10 [Entrophospora candida]
MINDAETDQIARNIATLLKQSSTTTKFWKQLKIDKSYESARERLQNKKPSALQSIFKVNFQVDALHILEVFRAHQTIQVSSEFNLENSGSDIQTGISVVRISDEREILNVEVLGPPFRSTKDHTVGDAKKLLIMAVCSLCYSLGDYLDCSVEDAKKVKSKKNTGSICSEHIIQPTPLGPFWTGKFSPKNLTFPNTQPTNRLKRILFRLEIDGDGIMDGDLPAFTINIFDSGDEKSAEAMYAEAVKDTYFDNSSDTSSLITSIFRANRYFIGKANNYHIRMTRRVTNRITPSFKDNFGFQPNRDTQSYITTIIYPTSRNSSFFAPGVAGFMIDPHNFVLETQTEQRQFLSVISNVLAVEGAFFTLYTFLFGVGRIKPLGVMHLKNSKTHDGYKNTSIPPSLFLKIDEGNRTLTTEERLDRLTALIVKHVIEISELDEKLKNNSDANCQYSRATGNSAAAATLSQ